jgi:class 3 adenylate cyclase/tetratricopeptide (TPR) repeat protein
MSRATATILFTDLVGSTELRGRLGEKVADELRRTHDQLLGHAIEASNGRVIKGLGDGIMATFAGASDAVAAAVAIQQGIDRLNRSSKVPEPLAVRIGLSAGDVSFEDEDVHGTPVIEASRLCAAAAGGEIVAAEVVRILAGFTGGYDYVSGGPLELKGLGHSVAALRIQWDPVAISTIPMPALLTDIGRIFVGRDGELERLGQLWKEAAAGERRVALLAGEPGVGKTRLAAELAIWVHEQGGVVLAGRCDEDLGVPYQPFVEALRHFVDHTPRRELAARLGRYGGELARLVPEVANAGLPAPLRSDPETERYRLFDAVGAWLAVASAEEPLCLVLDDLQWAAKPTLLLLRHVVRSPDAKGFLVLGTYRDTELGHDHPLVEVLADLRRQGGVQRLSLTGLDSTGVTAFMEQAAGHALGGEELALVGAIHEETEGNPFFVREVLRHLTETGAIERREGLWSARLPVEELGIPEGVREVVGRRLSRLSSTTNDMLKVAAVLGTEFELSLLQVAGEVDEKALLIALEEAIGSRLISEVPNPTTGHRFAHALVRDTLYHELSVARRAAIHRRVAEAIESVHAARLDDHLPALAHHWSRASAPAAETGKAVEYAIRAGDRALAQLAHDEAVTYYRSAFDLLDNAGMASTDGRRVELLISLGQAQLRAGDPDFRQTLLDAAALAKQAGDANALARAALANNRGMHSSSRGMDAERVTVLEDALRALPEADSTVRARLLGILATELWSSPDHARRYRIADEALAMARRLEDPTTLAQVLATRFVPLVMTAERSAEMAEFATLAGQLGDPALVFWATFFAGLTSLTVEDVRAFTAGIDEALQLAEELSQPTMRFIATSGQAMSLRLSGRLDDAEAAAQLVLEIGEAAGLPDARHVYEHSSLFWVRYDQGRLDELAEACERHASGMSPPSQSLPNLGLAYAELGRLDEARAVLDRVAADDFATISGGMSRIVELAGVAEFCAALRDRPRAMALHRLLAPYRGLIAHRGSASTGAVNHHLALLEAALDRFDEADISFASAAAVNERIGAPTWLARTRLEWARMLLRRGATGDAERARELLGRALDSARELGLANVERRAVELRY